MINISRRVLLGATGTAVVAGLGGGDAAAAAPAAADLTPLSITAAGSSWTLENDVLRVVVQFTAGSLTLSSVFNKAAGHEYQTVAAGKRLFRYDFNGARSVIANDGGWTLGTPVTAPITMFSRTGQSTVGQQLRLPLSRTAPLPLTVTAVFEIYENRAGLRFFTLLRNNDTVNQITVTASVVFALAAANLAHTLNFVTVARWQSTTGALAPTPASTATAAARAELPKKVLNVYTGNHGWSISPELNWKTQHGNGNHPTDFMLPPFASINAWSGIDHVLVQTNPTALQLVLFPREEFEYLAVNLTVFAGGNVEGKMADAEHFRKRFRYNHVTALFNTNDFGYRGSTRTLPTNYYYTTVIPKAAAAGLDMVMLDDFWNTTRDTTTPNAMITPSIGTLAKLGTAITAAGMQFGLWFSLSGGNHNLGRDLADPANLAVKRTQIESMMSSAKLTHQMVDLTEWWQNETTTTHSHASDNVYRKAVLCRRLLNDLVEAHPTFLPKMTTELDIFPTQGNRINGLMHVAYNGWTTSAAGITGETLSLQPALLLFGHLPMEAAYMNNGTMSGKMEDYYSFMAARNVKFGDDPGNATLWPTKGINLMATFNRWRKSPRVVALTDDLFRPVYLGTNWDTAAWNLTSGPYVWMYTNDARSRALMIATGVGGTATSVTADLRWLDPAATYLVSDITLDDNGTHTYAFRGAFTGAKLRTPGFPINLKTNTSRGKAFWIEKAAGTGPQVQYADERVTSWTAQASGTDLLVHLTGTANAATTIIVASSGTNRGVVRAVTLNAQGVADVTVHAADLLPPV
jgi:hypothetical protein